jgi:hypothetical protein
MGTSHLYWILTSPSFAVLGEARIKKNMVIEGYPAASYRAPSPPPPPLQQETLHKNTVEEGPGKDDNKTFGHPTTNGSYCIVYFMNLNFFTNSIQLLAHLFSCIKSSANI